MDVLVVKKASGGILLADPKGSLDFMYDELINILGIIKQPIQLGTVIADRKIYEINDKYCIAKSINAEVPQPYVVWGVDADKMGVHTGRYYNERMDAEWEFTALSFEWFEDNVMINFVEDAETAE